jgi:DNA-binding NarL/FixJ family response regulator
VLTKREIECLNKLCLGYSAKEIAKSLELSHRTVEDYLQKAKDKLGCSKRSDIIATMLNQPHDLNEKIQTLHHEIYNSQRFHEISVLVVDFSMPGMTGLELCEQLADKPFKKLLLTGKADEKIVIKAFNEGKIQKYIHKDSLSFEEDMNQAIRELQRNYFEDLSAVVINSIVHDPEFKNETIEDPVFIALVNRICQAEPIIEFHLMDPQGNFLLLDRNGHPSYSVHMKNANIDHVELDRIYSYQAFLESQF